MTNSALANRILQCAHEKSVRSKLSYDPNTGLFSWKTSGQKINFCELAGALNCAGYIQITVNKKQYSAHRLAWWLHYGEWPPSDRDIDHINGNRCDNRISNLRIATRRQNTQNQRRAHKNNQTGYLGVSFNPIRGVYRARITDYGKYFSLGCYKTSKEAYDAYLKAKAEKHEFQTIVKIK